jgi:hypothetical protein
MVPLGAAARPRAGNRKRANRILVVRMIFLFGWGGSDEVKLTIGDMLSSH